MRTLKRRTMIVPAERRELAALLCDAIAGPAGGGMFLRPLLLLPEPPAPPDDPESDEGWSAAEEEPLIAAYISSGRVEAALAELMPLNGEGGNPGAVASLAAQAGIQVDPLEIQALLDEADITDTDPHIRIRQLGYVLG